LANLEEEIFSLFLQWEVILILPTILEHFLKIIEKILIFLFFKILQILQILDIFSHFWGGGDFYLHHI
jgi:hypothetical protein